MTVKEITKLRKSGRLQEAFEEAEKEFATNKNVYTVGALFWCLNDFCKNEEDQDKLNSLYERMLSLRDSYCPNDEYMARSLKSLEAKIDPLGQELKLALENAKEGRMSDLDLNKFEALFQNGNLKESLYQDFGWLIYYCLKSTDVKNSNKRKKLLHLYFKLNLPRPDLLHSLILSEAINVEKNTPLQFRIRDFMKLWGWGNFIEDDWEQYPTEKGHKPSRIEKLISVYAKELITDSVSSPLEFTELVNLALEKFSNNQYLPLYKAYVLISLNKPEEAINYYRDLILNSHSKAFLWSQASKLVDNIDLKIALLCKALSVEKDETYIGRVRLNLISSLIEKGLLGSAKYELEKYKNFYHSKGWSLKPEYHELNSKIPVQEISENTDTLFKRFLPLSDDFIYGAIPSEFAIKLSDKQIEDKRHPCKKIIQWNLRTKNGVLRLNKPNKYGLDSRTKNGVVFNIKLKDGKIVWIKNSTSNPLEQDWIKKVEGTIRIRTDRNGKSYALLDGAYIGNKLLTDINDGDSARIIAIQQEDRRWSAIALTKI